MKELCAGLWDLGEWGRGEHPKYYTRSYFVTHVNRWFTGVNIRFVEMRDPQDHRDSIHNPTGLPLHWHQDCGASNHHLLIWANIHPTEMRHLISKEEIILEECHIYRFDNLLFEHRTPKAALNSERYFARVYLFQSVKE